MARKHKNISYFERMRKIGINLPQRQIEAIKKEEESKQESIPERVGDWPGGFTNKDIENARL